MSALLSNYQHSNEGMEYYKIFMGWGWHYFAVVIPSFIITYEDFDHSRDISHRYCFDWKENGLLNESLPYRKERLLCHI